MLAPTLQFFLRFCRYRLGWLSLLLGLLARPAQAQPAPVTFGLLDTRELTAAPFAHDSSAAVVLCDYGTTRIARGNGYWLQTVFERVLRVKILRKAGTEWGNLSVKLWPGEQLSSLRGCTYNLNGGTVTRSPLDGDGKFVEELGGRHRVYRLLLPNVREGSVVDFTYSVVSSRRTNLLPWQFQRTIPVRWSEYRVAFPAGIDFQALLHGALPLLPDSISRVAAPAGMFTQLWDHRWAMHQVPAFEEEPFSTTPLDYLAGLEFSWAGTHFSPNSAYTYENSWENIDQWLLNDDFFGRALSQRTIFGTELSQLPGLKASTLLARIAAVRELVMQHVKCNQEDGIWLSSPLRDTYRNTHQGNVADVNLLLVAALRAAHIDANPLLMSTRDHGRLNIRFPRWGAYNYVLAHVLLSDGQDLLLDATDPSLPSGTLPERCLSSTGRLLPPAPAPARWVTLRPRQRLTQFRQLQLSLSTKGEIRGTMHEEYSGYAAARLRAELAQQSDADYCRQLAARHAEWTLTNFVIGNRTAPDQPLTLDYTLATTPRPTADSTYYLSLLAEFGTQHNPFVQATRYYPIDFGMAQEETLLLTLTLPAGYAPAELPPPVVVTLPNEGGRYRCTTSHVGNTVQLSSRLTLQQPVYEVADYPNLRELYRLLLARHAQRLAIHKAS